MNRTLLLGFVLGALTLGQSCQSGPHVTLRRAGSSVLVEIDGRAFAASHAGGGKQTKPYLFPVFGVDEISMTRSFPLEDARTGEETDHPHHTGLWFAHGDVNGVDFWHGPGSEHPRGGRIIEDAVVAMDSGPVGVLKTRNHYEDESGQTLCSESREMRFFAEEAGRFIDFVVTIHADHGPVVMGDTKEGIMALRVPATLRLRGPVAGGQAVTSEGVAGAAGWGTRGTWADYHGEIDGQVVGVAIFDHPDNPVHPTRWIVRDYGLFGANPFGLHDFEKKPAGTGAVTIPEGREMVFRYRFFFHRGDPVKAGVAAQYLRFAGADQEE